MRGKAACASRVAPGRGRPVWGGVLSAPWVRKQDGKTGESRPGNVALGRAVTGADPSTRSLSTPPRLSRGRNPTPVQALGAQQVFVSKTRWEMRCFPGRRQQIQLPHDVAVGWAGPGRGDPRPAPSVLAWGPAWGAGSAGLGALGELRTGPSWTARYHQEPWGQEEQPLREVWALTWQRLAWLGVGAYVRPTVPAGATRVRVKDQWRRWAHMIHSAQEGSRVLLH